MEEPRLIKRTIERVVWDITVGNGSVDENTPEKVTELALHKCAHALHRTLTGVELLWAQTAWARCRQSVLQP